MNKQQQQSARSQRQAAAFSGAFSGAFGFETLESRQLMSAAPGVGSVGSIGPITALQNPVISMPKSPAVTTGTKTTIAVQSTTIATPVKSVDVQATAAFKTAGQTPTPPPTGGTTVAAKSLWGKIKAAAKWAKDHIAIGLDHIGIKGTF
jgi:hypothetical protein